MNYRFQRLLSPLRITENSVLRSRLIGSATSNPFVMGPQGYPTDALIHHYREMARNGAGLLQLPLIPWTTLEQRLKMPDTLDMVHMGYGLNYDDPLVQNLICQLTEEVHYFGAKIVLAVPPVLPGGCTLGGGDSVVQDAAGWHTVKNKMLPREMIAGYIDSVVKLSGRFKNWGCDGITVRADTFLTRSEDMRTDEYGGSAENRSRLVKEIFAAVKKEHGADFITEAVLGGEQPHGYQGSAVHGYTFEDTIAFCRQVEGLADIIQIRESDMALAHPTGYTHSEHEYRTLDYCRRLKQAGIKTPLSANGGFQDPVDMERALEDGVCDLFSLSRAYFCDPDYYIKLRDGRAEDITPCVQCNKCHGTYSAPWVTLCAVNPRYGMDHKTQQLERSPARPKKVAVIGGGPAGMRTALFMAEKGHSVTLFEKTDYLGGQLAHADYYRFKWPLRKYRLWLVDQLGKSDVELRMRCEPSPEELRAEGFEAVIAATGASAVKPPVEGADDPRILTCHDVWGKAAELGEHVVIVGGSEVGMETAVYLAQNGKKVTVLTRQNELGHDCSKIHYVTITHTKINPDTGWGLLSPEWEKYSGLTGITNARTVRVTPDSVVYEKDGKMNTVICDSVVVGGGVKPNIDSALRYSGITPDFHLVGDVEGGRGNLQRCNRSAFAKANML